MKKVHSTFSVYFRTHQEFGYTFTAFVFHTCTFFQPHSDRLYTHVLHKIYIHIYILILIYYTKYIKKKYTAA